MSNDPSAAFAAFEHLLQSDQATPSMPPLAETVGVRNEYGQALILLGEDELQSLRDLQPSAFAASMKNTSTC